jgi:hypothetical protein
MTGASPQDSLHDLPWGKVAGVAGGLAAAWLTVRGVAAVFRVAAEEIHYRVTHGKLTRRG